MEAAIRLGMEEPILGLALDGNRSDAEGERATPTPVARPSWLGSEKAL